MGKGFSRSRKLSVAVLVASLAALLGLFAAGATALPGDLPITPLTPADGASEPAVEEELTVSYTCPAFRLNEELVEEEEEPPYKLTELGSSENYGVVFSTGTAVGKDGRLVSVGFGEAGIAEAEGVKGTNTCTSELALPTAPNPPALYGGRVYWQPYRECEGCATGYETGPIRSFVVVPTDEEAEIVYQPNLFGGYLTKIDFFGNAGLKGAAVALQRWTGSGWETIATEPGASSGENSFYVVLGKGHQLLRPVINGTGVAPLPLEAKAKEVRKPKQAEKEPVKSGEWVYAVAEEREEFPIGFDVARNGTMLRGLNGPVEAFCTNSLKGEKAIRIESNTSVNKARIAPDGSVFAHFTTAGPTPSTVSLTGHFFNGRFSGVLTSKFLNCNGFREFEAVPAAVEAKKKKPKK